MAFIQLSYLLAAVLFILALKRLGSPATARGGNALAAIGMLVAILATMFATKESGESLVPKSALWIVGGGILVGSAIGAVMAQKVKMTAMPQMVALFNGFGGGASAVVAAAEYAKRVGETVPARASAGPGSRWATSRSSPRAARGSSTGTRARATSTSRSTRPPEA